MIKQKKGFWTFIFSFIPGAGEMHMGFMKQGISIMAVFWLTIGLASLLNIETFLLILPLLWFYSFFNVHNLKSLTEEEFYSLEDDYAFHFEAFISDRKNFVEKYRNILAAVLILIGLTVLWNNSVDFLTNILPQYFGNIVYRIANMVPQFVIGIGIIALGISMVKGKKKELEENENA